MKLGEIIRAVPYERREAIPGKVVYIHPRHRWYMLEFTVGSLGKKNKYRECYFMPSKSHIGRLSANG